MRKTLCINVDTTSTTHVYSIAVELHVELEGAGEGSMWNEMFVVGGEDLGQAHVVCRAGYGHNILLLATIYFYLFGT